MPIVVTDWTIPGSDGQPIYGTTHTPRDCSSGSIPKEPIGSLVCAHGFKGYKDYGFIPVLCDRAADKGLVAHRFNFSHSGMTPKHESFERPELFERDTWSKQVYDLIKVNWDAMHVALENWHDGWRECTRPVVGFGHSRGGVTSTLATGRAYAPDYYERFWEDAFGGINPAGLITAAAPDYACNLDDLVKDQLRAEGRLLSPSGRTGQDLYVGLDWLEEIERDPELYDPVLAAAHVKCPMLIIHGDDDPTVPVDCAHSLHQAATPNSRLEIIEGANHIFNCPNPAPSAKELPEQTRKMIDLSVAFAVECCEKASTTD